MIISKEFEGGNIRVLSMEDNLVKLECELRDTMGDWFYWAFRVRGAAGKRVTFDFSPMDRIGNYGPAVSHDLKTWAWGGEVNEEYTAFTYEFAPDEDDVYFCHSLPYSTERFARFVSEYNLPVTALCRSEQGREVPMVTLGAGDEVWLFTSRHHCCESTGTYVMEGILKELTEHPAEDVKVIAIPFVDIDGAVNGDQGKNRSPHDHNRDYTDQPIYQSVRSLQELTRKENITCMLDLHAPFHRKERYPFEVRKNGALRERQERFGQLLARECQADSEAFQYVEGHDLDVGMGWNVENAMVGACSVFFAYRPSVRLCVPMETPYFGTDDNRATQENLVRYGRCMARALKAIHEEGI